MPDNRCKVYLLTDPKGYIHDYGREIFIIKRCCDDVGPFSPCYKYEPRDYCKEVCLFIVVVLFGVIIVIVTRGCPIRTPQPPVFA